MKLEYINLVSSLIKNKRSRPAITAELDAHIEDKILFYQEQGKTREEAERLAVEEMGDPEQTADSLNALHGVVWYRQAENIISLAALAAIALLLAFFALAAPVYMYSDTDNMHPHRLFTDLISLFVFTVLAAVIYLGFRKKSLFVVKSVFVFTILQIVMNAASGVFSSFESSFELFPQAYTFFAFLKPISFFEPLGYLFATLFTGGPAAYIGSLLTESYIPSEHGVFYLCFSWEMWLLLFVADSLAWSYIVKNSLMKPDRKLKKRVNALTKGLIIFCAAYFAVIGSCGIAASFNKDSIRDRSDSEFFKMKSFVLSEDLSSKRELEDIIEDIEKNGFKGSYVDGENEEIPDGAYMYSGRQNYLVFSNYYENGDDGEKLVYVLTCGVNDRGGFLNARQRCYGTDFLDFKQGYKLEKFMKNPLFDKASLVSKTTDSLSLTFVLNSGDPYSEDGEVTLSFSDGRLSYNSLLEDTEDETVEIPPDATGIPSLW